MTALAVCQMPFIIAAETDADVASRDILLDRAMGPRWRRKASEKLRRGRLPAEGLAFVARDGEGRVVGTVRLWNVRAGQAEAGWPEGGASDTGNRGWGRAVSSDEGWRV